MGVPEVHACMRIFAILLPLRYKYDKIVQKQIIGG